MRQLVLLATWTLVGTLLVVSGVYVIMPGRNLHGNPWRERETASCVLPDTAEVTLYQGGDAGGSGPTWYSVTHNPKGFEPERQILYRFRSPPLYDLFCDASGVVIRTDGPPITLTTAQARQLRQRPSALQPIRVLQWVVGTALILGGLALLWFLRPRSDD
jgi:hypothetical protein